MENRDPDLDVQLEDWERQPSEPTDLETEDRVNREANPRIIWGRVDSVNLYEVTEHELEILAKGSEATLHFSFAIFLLSVACTCAVALGTSKFESETMGEIFLFVCVVGFIVGIFLLISWFRSRKSVKNIISIIKDRIGGSPSQGITP